MPRLHPYLRRFLLWSLWLLTGCVFYSLDLRVSYSKALYYSVLVGYNIGWNFEEDTHHVTEYFSIAHMVVGVCAVTVLLEEYLQHILDTDTQWYQAVLEKEEYMRAVQSGDVKKRLKYGVLLHKYTIFPSLLWLGVLVCGSVSAYLYTSWSVADSCFFTLSTLFAGGFAVVPDTFSNFQYFCVSMFAAFGVPLTMYCFSSVAALFVSSPHSDKFAAVCKTCDISDLKMMQSLNLENRDGHLDKSEYIILCMLRLRAIDPDLVAAINQQFDALDTDKNGILEYAELLEINEHNVRLKSLSRDDRPGGQGVDSGGGVILASDDRIMHEEQTSRPLQVDVRSPSPQSPINHHTPPPSFSPLNVQSDSETVPTTRFLSSSLSSTTATVSATHSGPAQVSLAKRVAMMRKERLEKVNDRFTHNIAQ